MAYVVLYRRFVMRKVNYETQEQREQLINEASLIGEMLIKEENIVDGNFLTFDEPCVPTIEELKKIKMDLLDASRDKALTRFKSSCLGCENEYKYEGAFDVDFYKTAEDIINMGIYPDTQEQNWYVFSLKQSVPHTQAQIRQLIMDRKMYFMAVGQEYGIWMDAINTAESKEDLDLVPENPWAV